MGRMLWRLILKALLPSWNFFDEVGESYELQHRVRLGAGRWGVWTPTLIQADPRWVGALFLNPQGNLRLAQRSIGDRLVRALDEAAEGASPAVTQVHRELEDLVRSQVARMMLGGDSDFEFRLASGENVVFSSSPRRVRR
jgi:hypothetical protein